MSGIARMLRSEGHTVTGTDAKTTGNGAHLLPNEVDVVIYTEAVLSNPAGAEELATAKERGVKTLRRIDFIAERMQGKISIAIAGAHGKSTTTAMIGWSLTEAKKDPTVFIGADMEAFGGSARGGAGMYVVTEACEWNKQFLDLHPTVLVLTTIDREHLDTYPGGIEDVKRTFRQFAEQVDPKGFIVANGDDENLRSALSEIDRTVVWFGLSEELDYRITSITTDGPLLEIGLMRQHETASFYTSHQVGKHHTVNIIATVVALLELEISPRVVQESVTSFPGLKRRFERYRDDEQLTVVDDYAHHPTEILATLTAAKQRYPDRRIVCVFQPHLSQRTTDLFNEFIEALSVADKVFVAETFEPAGRVLPENAKKSIDLVVSLREKSVDAVESFGLDQTISIVENDVRLHDVVITVGATNIWKVAEALSTWKPNDK